MAYCEETGCKCWLFMLSFWLNGIIYLEVCFRRAVSYKSVFA